MSDQKPNSKLNYAIPGLTKLRLLLGEYDREVMVALVVVGAALFLVAGALAFAPGTTTTTEQRNPQQVDAGVNTSAVVTGNSTVWKSGTVLRDEPMYLTAASPTLRLDGHSALPDANADVDQRLELVYQVTRDEKVVWERSETLVQRNATDTDGLTTNATLNASAVQHRLDEIHGEFGGAGRPEARVRLTVDYETGTYADSQVASAPLSFEGRGYSLGSLSVSETHTTPVSVVRTEPVDWVRVAGLAFLGSGSFVGAFALSRREFGTETESVRAELLHERHREWISEARLSEADRTAERVVHVASLTDLVDLGIDSENRVLHDPEKRLYAVFDGQTSYYYRRPASVIADIEAELVDRSATPPSTSGDD